MGEKIIHFLYVPFTGLGLYGGWRGMRWFKNRIQIFKQFVVPSLLAQTNKDFIVWISFTRELKYNVIVNKLKEYLDSVGLKSVFTYSGVCFFDDKYPTQQAQERLSQSLHDSIGELVDTIGDADYVYMTIQPSDDCYCFDAVETIQKFFNKNQQCEAVGFQAGYIMDYKTLEVSEYNPTTNPPFYTIKFPKAVFVDPHEHCKYTSLKKDVEKYPKGTPLPSHEYVGDCLKYYAIMESRGFLVGCHGENISTYYNHPFKGKLEYSDILWYFGLNWVHPLQLKISIRKKILRKLPHKVQRKLRYLFGEKIWNKIYEFLRNK